MTRLAPLLALLLFTACGADNTADKPASPPEASPPAKEAAGARSDIDVPALKAALDAGSVRLLVDVRTDSEYRGGHVPGAVHIPLADLGRRMGELGTAEAGPVHLICQSGGRSGKAADLLVESGYTAINVAGGTGAWRAAGYPVE